ncbi:Alpha/Beta hydrolase protein [Mycena rosella]|uniref:Alpha/Beta hydrolase protein n=1 Tax=Mycena rosella TaxID=1033263 RepID=A0AAD7GQZ8_MYCRO|nr:Alpha/Beta hydrolase protein [Mycena rosella]
MLRSVETCDVCYKKIDQTPIYFNVYPPALQPQSPYPRLPAVVYFHGGGLTVGNRTSWFPNWLKARIVSAGYVFISADYRLIPSVTLHDIIEDIQDAFSFLRQDGLCFKTADGDVPFGVDPASIAVAGSSAGGLCAYMAALHVSPKPKAVLALYAVGGNPFIPQCLTPKTEVFFLGRELLDPEDFSEFLYPRCKTLAPIADSPLAYHPTDSPTPGWPANPRMPLSRLYLQLGVALDYHTGQHEPSLSATLRSLLLDTALTADPLALQDAMKARIPPVHHVVFPSLNVTPSFPPTFLCHGSIDSAVPVVESEHMHALLKRAGVPVRLLVLDGADHSFDYVPNAETLYAAHFDEMAEFVKRALAPT